MIPINTVIGVLACLVCVIGFVSLALLIRAHSLYTQAINILEVAAYGWLKQNPREQQKQEQEVTKNDKYSRTKDAD